MLKEALRRCSHLNHQVNVRWDCSDTEPVLVLSGLCQVSFLAFELWTPYDFECPLEYRGNFYTSPVNPFRINWLEPVEECIEKQFFNYHPTCSVEPTVFPTEKLRDVLEQLVSRGIISVAVTNYPGRGVEFSGKGMRTFIFEKEEPTIDSVKYTKNFLVIGLVNSLAAAVDKAANAAVTVSLTMDATTPLLLEYAIDSVHGARCTLKTRHCHLDD